MNASTTHAVFEKKNASRSFNHHSYNVLHLYITNFEKKRNCIQYVTGTVDKQQ